MRRAVRDSCNNVQVPPPDEVLRLTLDSLSAGSTVAVLAWGDVTDADWYNVYRGEQPNLGDLSCYASGVLETGLTDDGNLGVGGLYLCLATAEHCDLESTLGEDSDEDSRTNPSPCP